MNPPMHTRVRDCFVSAGLTTGFKTQLLIWSDSGVSTDAFMVFRPDGGSSIRYDLGSDYYILVDVVGAEKDSARTDSAVQAIIEYVQKNPMADECVGYLQNMGGIPSPVLTTEGRLVYRLQFVATHGD